MSLRQHTLDSDEEDNEEETTKYDVMTEDDVEGQEEQTVDFDDGEKITPFNMKEEMEEGHFDKQGNYFFKKDAEIKVRKLRVPASKYKLWTALI